MQRRTALPGGKLSSQTRISRSIRLPTVLRGNLPKTHSCRVHELMCVPARERAGMPQPVRSLLESNTHQQKRFTTWSSQAIESGSLFLHVNMPGVGGKHVQKRTNRIWERCCFDENPSITVRLQGRTVSIVIFEESKKLRS